MKMLHLLFLLKLILSVCSSHGALEFCVGDLALPQSSEGYACKNVSQVTIGDFVFTGFRNKINTSNTFKAGVIPAFSAQFPGMNGLGLSIVCAEIDVGGAVPLHSHPDGSEIVVVVEGTIVGGLISLENVAFYKKLIKGDVMVFPKGLLYFQVNTGKVPVKFFASFNSANPGVQLISGSLFGNSLPSMYVEKTTLIAKAEVNKLKAMLGGSG